MELLNQEWKKPKDEARNVLYGTDDVDIANCSFDELSSNWQYENLEAARVAIGLVYDKTIGEMITPEEAEVLAATIHEEWLMRNDWVYNPEYGNPELAVPYADLSQEEKDKDKAQIQPAVEKVQAYMDGLINIEEICNKFGISQGQSYK